MIECLHEQYSAGWWEARRGLPTASQFARIVSPTTFAPSKQADAYIAELIAEKIIPCDDPQTYTSAAMERGTALEADARNTYAFEFDDDGEVQECGLCLSDSFEYGASPDALVGDEGCLEIKCPLPKTHVEYLLGGGLPAKYRPQVHGHLLVTGRAWCDFVSFCPGSPMLRVRIERSADTDKLGAALDAFCERLEKKMGDAVSLAADHGYGSEGGAF